MVMKWVWAVRERWESECEEDDDDEKGGESEVDDGGEVRKLEESWVRVESVRVMIQK